MKIGIVSDSHGKAARLRAAMDVFAQHGVEAVVHCGDVGSVECVEILAGSGGSAYLVLGNMDHRGRKLLEAAGRCGVKVEWDVVEVPIGGGEFLVATHGHDEGILSELIHGRQFPYVCHGHTHRARDERVGKVRVINPGSLYHPRDKRRQVAALDTKSDTLEHIELP